MLAGLAPLRVDAMRYGFQMCKVDAASMDTLWAARAARPVVAKMIQLEALGYRAMLLFPRPFMSKRGTSAPFSCAERPVACGLQRASPLCAWAQLGTMRRDRPVAIHLRRETLRCGRG